MSIFLNCMVLLMTSSECTVRSGTVRRVGKTQTKQIGLESKGEAVEKKIQVFIYIFILSHTLKKGLEVTYKNIDMYAIGQ